MLSMVRTDEQDVVLIGARLLWWGDVARQDEPALLRLLNRGGAIVRVGEAVGGVDAVLLDVDGVGGEGVLRRFLREGVPVIAFSWAREADRLAWALEVGAEEAVSAWEAEALALQRVRGVLRRRRREMHQDAWITQLQTYLPTPATRPHGGPERLTVSVLFSDLRGFTAASASQDAAEVFETINQIIAAQIEHIQEAGGYVDGFSGDGLLALFEGADSAAQACRAAEAILGWADGTAIGPWSKMPVAMGLHRGEVVRGDLGVAHRRVFTALGSPINVAARLCGVALAREAVASQELIARLPPAQFGFGMPRRVDLKGIPAPLLVQTLRVAPPPPP